MNELKLTESEFRAVETALYIATGDTLSLFFKDLTESKKVEYERNLQDYQTAFNKICLAMGKQPYELIERVSKDLGL